MNLNARAPGISLHGRAGGSSSSLFVVFRALTILVVLAAFLPGLNPARVTGLVNRNVSLFTSGTSYSSLVSDSGRAILRGWVDEGAFRLLFSSSAAMVLGIMLIVACACLSLGNLRCRRLGNALAVAGGGLQAAGLVGVLAAWRQFLSFPEQERVKAMFPDAFWVFALLALLCLLIPLIIQLFLLDRAPAGMKYEMRTPYRLFLMFLPFAVLSFIFAYLPLMGWRYAFFDYKAGGSLTADNFAGLKWFGFLMGEGATRADILHVMRNTLVMSGLGILTSWVPMALAIMLSEFGSKQIGRASCRERV